ncbi:MGMT family protein [Methanocaldococcus indicus]|uniref:MGMT family protein n=1 Tax=Methanocaldococcus indicus TaxID=213231 RepID=UPI003C6D5F8C
MYKNNFLYKEIVKINNYYIGLEFRDNYLVRCSIPLPKEEILKYNFGKINNKYTDIAKLIYKLYFCEIDDFYVRKHINHKLLVSEFTFKVLNSIKNIKKGKTITYGVLAKLLNTSPRAVGKALNKNPLPLIYPCHRVVKKNDLGGYSFGIKYKIELLKREGAI